MEASALDGHDRSFSKAAWGLAQQSIPTGVADMVGMWTEGLCLLSLLSALSPVLQLLVSLSFVPLDAFSDCVAQPLRSFTSSSQLFGWMPVSFRSRLQTFLNRKCWSACWAVSCDQLSLHDVLVRDRPSFGARVSANVVGVDRGGDACSGSQLAQAWRRW
ncbi:hypothetical protein ACOMHN_029684 [Nucella lapillus]